jgi:hypothetical protein
MILLVLYALTGGFQLATAAGSGPARATISKKLDAFHRNDLSSKGMSVTLLFKSYHC